MEFLTQDKLTLIGAGGMIGSNMVQTAIMMGLTPNICAYDPYAPALEGMAEEMFHSGFDRINLTFTDNIEAALKDAVYVVSSGGAARKAGMTREDLLRGNAEIAAQLGRDLRRYGKKVRFVVIVFNPADITGLVTLLYSGLEPSRLCTLAALDSTRLQTALAQYFGIPRDRVQNARTYGGHGEQMAVFASTARIDGNPLSTLIGTPALPEEQWKELQQKVIQGGKRIIDLRGRSSFQSPAYLSVEMIRAAMGGEPFRWPAGVYVNRDGFDHIMMAMETDIDRNGVTYRVPQGTPAEMEALRDSYLHLSRLRDEVIRMGIIPPVPQWARVNPYLA